MALVAIPGGGLVYPSFPYSLSSLDGNTNCAIEGETERFAWIVQVPRDGTLDRVEYYSGFIAALSGATVRFSFQDLSSGVPDGTQDQFRDVPGANIAVGWNVTGLLTSDGTDGGNKRTVSRGDWLAVVVEFETFNTGARLWFYSLVNNNNPVYSRPAYMAFFNGTSWNRNPNQGLYPGVALRYSDGSYARLPGFVFPIAAMNNRTFSSSSTPDECGIRFRLPFAAEIGGASLYLDLDNACDVVLYDAADNVLASESLDPANQAASNRLTAHVQFASPVALDADAWYRLVVKPTTTSDVTIYEFTVNEAALLDAFEGGQDFHLTTRTDGGAWTDTPTQRPWMALILTGIDNTGGGSGSGRPVFVIGD